MGPVYIPGAPDTPASVVCDNDQGDLVDSAGPTSVLATRSSRKKNRERFKKMEWTGSDIGIKRAEIASSGRSLGQALTGKHLISLGSVSYTHLTLPTRRTV